MPHILIIEDYHDNRAMLELILQDAGYITASAGDGRSGVAAAHQLQPDLILMDLALPGLNGWDATRCLKAHPATQHIPVVAFTALVSQDDLARAQAVGCVAIIAKPFELDGLLAQVAAILAQQRQQTGEVGDVQAVGDSSTLTPPPAAGRRNTVQ
jgi:two-component system cell cycle response regulator DivK